MLDEDASDNAINDLRQAPTTGAARAHRTSANNAQTLKTFTPDVVHDVVGDPAGVLHGPDAVAHRYSHLFSNVRGEHADVKHRLYGENFVVDDKIWTARVDGDFLGIRGNGRRINVRVLHVFEFRDGLISRENVWLDAAAAMAQLTADT